MSDLFNMAGMDLPQYLGNPTDKTNGKPPLVIQEAEQPKNDDTEKKG